MSCNNLRRLAAGTTALHEAAESDNVEVVAMLLDGGADVGARTFREEDQLSCLNGLGQVDVYTLWSKIIDVWREMFRSLVLAQGSALLRRSKAITVSNPKRSREFKIPIDRLIKTRRSNKLHKS